MIFMHFAGFLFGLLLMQIGIARDINAVVLDAHTKQPIPYATIQYGPNKGVVTNDEGRFNLIDKTREIESITVSSMGYGNLTINVGDIKDETIYLAASNIELTNIFLTNKNLTPQEIIKKVRENVNSN